jgi:hypothetical protein
MSTFDNRIVEIPQHSRWHLFTGSIVLMTGSIGSLWGIVWLLAA